jgi:hypothetical protein
MHKSILAAVVFFVSTLAFWHSAAAEIPPIPRVLPPEGLEIPADVRERLETRLAATKKRMQAHKDHTDLPDVEIFTKAVELALIHREFYVPKDFAKADWALDEANKRLDSLDKGESPWTRATGLIVRGYRSGIDGSAQPYGVEIPDGHDFEKPCPLYVWLHGRGDKNTDLHFLYERATKPGQIKQPGVIILHPFGRHCVGYKHAGEVDVLDVVGNAYGEYMFGAYNVALMGFSMGGAGAWHIGAHRADQWVAVSPGAGFVETARYNKLTPDKYPPWYEQKLWGQYDVPNYVRNLFNTETIAYSGELDKQIQAARVMEEAFRSEGGTLTHLIGPGVEHKYERATLQELLKRVESAVYQGRDEWPKKVHLQTRTLRYAGMHWVTILAMEQHWEDARVDAALIEPDTIKLATKNVTALYLQPPGIDLKTLQIDGQEVTYKQGTQRTCALFRESGRWRVDPIFDIDDWPTRTVKTWKLHGPIDDAFSDEFLVITPTGKSKNPRFQAWVDFELDHLRKRWRALMRAELPEKRDVDVNIPATTYLGNLILWGDADSNSVIAELQAGMPAEFKEGSWSFGQEEYDGDRFVPVVIYPRKAPNGVYRGYTVFNSGLTFREGHDRTNSLQNPKLPDWAIIDITQPPDAFAPGRIHDAGFFDEEWKLKGPVIGP